MITMQFGEECRADTLKGMEKVYKAVSKSMGPAGRNMLFESKDSVYLSKDGATIARWIAQSTLVDRFENSGAQLIRKASQKTEEDAGDGTTAATVFSYKLAVAAQSYVNEGANVMKVKKGMEQALESVIASLTEIARPAKTKEEWTRVAYISSQDAQIAEMIGEAMEKVGPEGHISVEKGFDWEEHELKLEVKEGMHFDRGYVTDTCINDFKAQSCKLTAVPIIVTDIKLANKVHFDHLKVILDGIIEKTGKRQAVVVAMSFDGLVKDFIINNNIAFAQTGGQKGMNILAVEAPGYGAEYTNEFCDDIAVLTGATLISEAKGTSIESVRPSMLGEAEIVESTSRETHIVNTKANKEAMERRLAEIDAKKDNAKGELERKRMEERRAALTTGFALVTVGGHTDVNISERKDRVDDAVLATKCAYEEGIVPGCGIAYIRCIKKLKELKSEDKDINAGIRIVEETLKAPLIQIAENCGENAEKFVTEALSHANMEQGFNAATSFSDVEDMFAEGIVDPVKVCKVALRQGIEIASAFLTTETSGITIPLDSQQRPILEFLRGDATERINRS